MATDQLNSNWQTGKSVTECLQFALDNELWCDVTINVHCGGDVVSKIQVHEFILKVRSPVFEAMFSGNFTESSREINLKHSDPDLVLMMIRYMYSDKVNITLQNVLGLRDIARMYMIGCLEDQCVHFIKHKLKSKLSINNVHIVLTNATDLCQDDAVDECLRFCEGEYIAHVLASEHITDLSVAALCKLVKYDRLMHAKEMDLLQACLRWAKQQSGEDNMRTRLGQVVHEIRFARLSPEEFSTFTMQENSLLTANETSHVNNLLTSNDAQVHKQELSQMGFNMVPRVTAWKRKLDTSWSAPKGSTFEYHGIETLQLHPEEDSILHGIAVMPGTDGLRHSFSLKTGYTTLHSMDDLASAEEKIHVEGPSLVYPLYLSSPVKLTAGHDYTIVAYPPNERECFFRAIDATVFSGDRGDVTVGTDVCERAAVVQGKPDINGFSRDWRLSYIHTLYLQLTD